MFASKMKFAMARSPRLSRVRLTLLFATANSQSNVHYPTQHTVFSNTATTGPEARHAPSYLDLLGPVVARVGEADD